MFTGLVGCLGSIKNIAKKEKDITLTIEAGNDFLSSTKLGDSISVNGVCLTVTAFTETTFNADVSSETLSCTSFDEICEGLHVNLEHCLTLSKPIGGHLLTGHIHGVGVIRSIVQDGRSEIYEVAVPDQLMKYLAPKGSIAFDGISLTVNNVRQTTVLVSIIPHTAAHTNLQYKPTGDRIKIKVDLLCLYLERLLSLESQEDVRLIDIDLMERLGFSRTEH